MIKAHSPINWENEPSSNTPINETNLNKMDSTIGVLDDRIIEHDTSKLDKSTAYTMVKDISFNENNGVFTVTRLNGSTFTIDTRLEKIAINFRYDYSTQKLIVTLVDGTTQSIDMSTLLTQYEFENSNTISWEVSEDGKVKAKILDGSITEDMLQPNYLAEIKLETEKSAQSMANAKQSELNAKASEESAAASAERAEEVASSGIGNILGNFASEYDSTSTYAVGDYVIYDGLLYKCTTAVTVAESFDSTKWVQTDCGTELDALNEGIDGLFKYETFSVKALDVNGTQDFTLNIPTDYSILSYSFLRSGYNQVAIWLYGTKTLRVANVSGSAMSTGGYATVVYVKRKYFQSV
jgi:hypothetical protein